MDEPCEQCTSNVATIDGGDSMRCCKTCNEVLTPNAKFCGACGMSTSTIKANALERHVRYIIVFYIAFLVLAIVNTVVFGEAYSFVSEVVMEGIFVLTTIAFCFLDFKNILKLYLWKNVNSRGLLLAIGVPILSGFLVYFGIDLINAAVGLESMNYYAEYVMYDNAFFWAFLFVAIVPPVFEELAFRGFLFNQMEKVTTTRITILATAFIFALIHFSFISLLWIFPFGVFLGYLRHKYQTLWLGMIAHFIHNAIVLVMDYQDFQSHGIIDFF